MNKFCNALALTVLSASLVGGSAYAQDHHDNDKDKDHHHYVEHKEWKRGQHIKHEDWDRGEHVDYRQYHLTAPPRGYEWRMVDGNYVMVNVGNFEIRTVVVPH